MNATTRATLAAIALALPLSIAACSVGPVDETYRGNLEDGAGEYEGRTCDAYDVELGRDWNITASMTSVWDNYLYLTRDGQVVARNDDHTGLNAYIDTRVRDGGRHVLHACAYSDGRGGYTLTIQTRSRR